MTAVVACHVQNGTVGQLVARMTAEGYKVVRTGSPVDSAMVARATPVPLLTSSKASPAAHRVEGRVDAENARPVVTRQVIYNATKSACAPDVVA